MCVRVTLCVCATFMRVDACPQTTIRSKTTHFHCKIKVYYGLMDGQTGGRTDRPYLYARGFPPFKMRHRINRQPKDATNWRLSRAR